MSFVRISTAIDNSLPGDLSPSCKRSAALCYSVFRGKKAQPTGSDLSDDKVLPRLVLSGGNVSETGLMHELMVVSRGKFRCHQCKSAPQGEWRKTGTSAEDYIISKDHIILSPQVL